MANNDEQQHLLPKKVTSGRPWLLDIRASKEYTQATVTVSIFTDDVLYGIVVPVLPNLLRERFELPDTEIQQWVSVLLGIFGATSLVTALVAGWITDRSKSRQRTFLAGLVALTAATILLYIGSSIPLLVLARALQGVATAIVHTVGIALVVDKSPPDQLGWALGIVGAGMTAAVVAGPLLGGILYKYAGYHAVFGLSFGLLGLDIIMRLFMIENIPEEWQNNKPDQNGYGSTNGNENGQANGHANGHAPSNYTEEQQNITEESDDGEELTGLWRYVPSGFFLLASARIDVCLFAAVMNASMLTCFDSTLPIFVRETFDWNPALQGLIFLTIAIPSLFAPLTGWVSDKTGVRIPITVGFILAAPAFACLSFVNSATTGQEALLCILLVVIGICLTLIHPATMAEVNHAVRAEVAAHPARYRGQSATGQANAIRNCAFSGGITLGPLFAGFVKARAGWPVMVSIMGLLALLTAPLTLVFAGGRLKMKKLW